MAAGEQQADIEKLLKDYQMLQEQIRSVGMQVEQLQAQKLDMERANEELGKSTGKIYISVGGVIVETTKEKAIADISDRASLTNARLQSANKTYTEMRSREKQLNEKITALYRGSGAGT